MKHSSCFVGHLLDLKGNTEDTANDISLKRSITMADPNELRDFQELYAELQRQNNRSPEYQALGEKAEAFLTDPGDMSPQAVSTVK